MDLWDTIIDYLINQDFSVAWGVISALIGYLVYNQRQICSNLQKEREELFKLLKENKYRHNKIEEDVQNLRQSLKEDVLPILRKIELDIQDLEDINRTLDEVKADERGWFSSLRDDFNQFRSEFRDILKLVLNGRKIDR